MYTKRRSNPSAWCAALVLVLGTFAANALADPPGRVARVGFLSGSVSFQPAGDDQWAEAVVNRPVATGDKLYTDQNSRAELEIGAASIRLDGGSTFDLLNLDDNVAQLELTAGVMNLHVSRIESGQSYEIDTPTLAFAVSQPGNYRIDIAPNGSSTMISVFDGAGDVYGENNASYSVRSGSSYRFNDSALQDYEVLDVPQPDEFDRWSSTRDARSEHSVSRTYVSEDVIGANDLDDYGSWNDEPEYGHVWYPSRVEADWAPYRSGHWSWIDPWGWTWVDNAAWGFAPFHYGRWAYVGNRWGWCPGRREVRSIYAPALVAFVGGGGWGTSISVGIGGGPVGWFPLGPRDVYVPWYQASRGYFTNINSRGSRMITNVNITNVYNNYSNGRPITNGNYAYRNNIGAVTAVSRETFVGSRPVAASRVRVDAGNLRNAQVVSRVGIAPVQASFGANAARSRALPAAATFNRKVIARTAPPPRPAPIAARLQAIQRNNAQPLQQAQLRQIAATRASATTQTGRAAAPARVQVVGGAAKPRPLPARANAATARSGAPTAPRAAAAPRGAVPAPNAADARQRTAQPGARTNPATREALPSSRFAPGRGNPAAGNPARTAPANRADPATARTQNGQANRQAPTPASRAPVPDAQQRSTGRNPAASRNLPSERFAPRTKEQAGSAPPASHRPQPAPAQRPAQPVQRENPRAMPQPARSAPAPQRETRQAPAQRSAPQPVQRQQPREDSRPAPQPRNTPQPQQRVQPQPQQRAQPQPRAQPQQRAQPQPQQRSQPQPQPRAQPQERKAPPAHRDDKKKDDDNGH